MIKHHKQFIYQIHSTSKQLSIINNLITKQLSNLSNSPTKLITYILLPLLGYWSGGMRGAVGIRPPSPRGDGRGRVVGDDTSYKNSPTRLVAHLPPHRVSTLDGDTRQ